MFGPKIQICPELWEKLTERANVLGYSSVQEFATHVLEREGEAVGEGDEEEEVQIQRLEGLGYLS